MTRAIAGLFIFFRSLNWAKWRMRESTYSGNFHEFEDAKFQKESRPEAADAGARVIFNLNAEKCKHFGNAEARA